MFLKALIQIVITSILLVDSTILEFKKQVRLKTNRHRICYNVTIDPEYKRMAVIGKPWHVYYVWNYDLGELCFKTVFKFPFRTGGIVKHLQQKHFGLYEEPRWSKPELFMYQGEQKQMVLFKDRSGIPGQFDGLPYYRRSEFPDEIPLRTPYKMTMKVIGRGKYLFMSDCTSGVTYLFVHPKGRPKRKVIEEYAAQFNFGIPYPACIDEPDPVIINVTKPPETTTTEVVNITSKYDW